MATESKSESEPKIEPKIEPKSGEPPERPKQQGAGKMKSSPGKVFGKLEQVFDDVWWAWGTVRMGPGVRFSRNMTIVRERGELVVIHPVLMPGEEQAKIEALGPIKHIVRLGAFHGMDDAKYLERYKPAMWAPPGIDLPAGATDARELRPGGPLPIEGATLLSFDSSKTPEAVMLLPRHGGVLLTCDSVQNWDAIPGCTFLARTMTRMMGFKGRACIGPGWRKQCEPKDGTGFRPDFEKLLELPFCHALGGHGEPMKDTAKDDLRAQVRKVYKA
jgi:hypothetical protein